MKEIFKDVKGFEGLYQVSNLGRLRSLGNSQKRKCKIRKPFNTIRGYPYIRLHKKNKRTGSTIHRLVANAFIPNPENKATVNHINGIKTDNRVENLEWNTYKENVQHSLRTGLRKAAYKIQTTIIKSGRKHFAEYKLIRK
jgi:hypothetical protein